MSNARERVEIAVLQVKVENAEKKIDSLIENKADKSQVEEVLTQLANINKKLDRSFITRREVGILRWLIGTFILALGAIGTILLARK